MDVAVVRIDDTDYTIVDIIGEYTYLMDLDNPNDFLIMKTVGEELVSVSDEDEYNIALNLYKEKLVG